MADKKNYRERRKNRAKNCSTCNTEAPFFWHCRCGFALCQECMEENFWGLSCNGITWQCPECGNSNGLGNQ